MPHVHQHSLAQSKSQLWLLISVDDYGGVSQSTSFAVEGCDCPPLNDDAVNLERLLWPFADVAARILWGHLWGHPQEFS